MQYINIKYIIKHYHMVKISLIKKIAFYIHVDVDDSLQCNLLKQCTILYNMHNMRNNFKKRKTTTFHHRLKLHFQSNFIFC